MRAIYYLWFFLNMCLNTFSKKLENFFFLYSDEKIYRFKDINIIQRIFLIFFYNSTHYGRLNLSYRDKSNLGLDRLKNYRNVHNFMTYAFFKKFKKNINNNKKTKYSFIKLGFMFNSNITQANLLLLIIFYTRLNSSIKNYKLNFFWNTLVPKSPSIINAVIIRTWINHINSEVSYYKYNTSTLLGFNSFIAKLDEFNINFKNDKLNERKKKLLSVNYEYNIFLNKSVEKKYKNYKIVLNQYKKFYKLALNINFNIASNQKLYLYFKDLSFSHVLIKKKFFDFYKSFLTINNLPTDVSKYFCYNSNVTALFIRKNKIFNKGRYSRNRQLYRTGVYWCLILNILGVFGLYYYFYRFVFNFGYFWLPLCILILSIFGSRLVKYRFYNIFNIINEINLFVSLINSFLHVILVNTSIRFKKFTIKMYYLLKFKLWFTFRNMRRSIIEFFKNS